MRDGNSTIRLEQLAAISEVAEMVGVTSGRIHQMLSEYPSFPRPIWNLKLGRIWDADEIKVWVQENRVPLERAPVSDRRVPQTAPAPVEQVRLSPQDRASKLSALLGRAS